MSTLENHQDLDPLLQSETSEMTSDGSPLIGRNPVIVTTVLYDSKQDGSPEIWKFKEIIT